MRMATTLQNPLPMDPITTSQAPVLHSAYGAWISVVVLALLAIAVVGGALLAVRVVTRMVDRIADSKQRLTTYECGEAPVGSAWFRFNNRFTTVALTFLIFDVELALLWPILPRCLDWIGSGNAMAAFIEITAFSLTLAIGLAWVAAGGGFIWDRTVENGGTDG
jgi:NADH-quinone oxidoreductase subunit A